IAIEEAGSYFPSGRSVAVDGGTFTIASTYEKPLMAELSIKVSGAADALAELADFDPLNALKDTDFTPADFSGRASAEVSARMGLIRDQNPPPPEWTAAVELADVDLKNNFSG